MMDRKLLANYGLKWNPFSLQLPPEALQRTAPIDSFCRRVENLAREGGFALVTGDAGTGKSSAMRLLVEHLSQVRDLRVGEITRPQSHMADFYRELGELFGIRLTPHNRWAGTKVLASTGNAHIGSVLYRPVVLVDEARRCRRRYSTSCGSSSVELDSKLLPTVVLAGYGRLTSKLRTEELVSLGSRIRVRLNLEPLSSQALAQVLRQGLENAGNPRLMTDELITTIADHAAGNHRVLMNLAADLLAAAAERDLSLLDEKLYFELYALPKQAPREAVTDRPRRSRR